MANWPTNQEVNIKEEETSQEVNQSEIINTTENPVVEQVDPTVTEDVVIETAPAEDIVETAPIVEATPVETPVVETTPVETVVEETPTETVVKEEKPLQSLDQVQLSDSIKDAFIRANEKGISRAETVENIKTKLSQSGFDVSQFDQTYWELIGEFDSLNKSQDDFFSALQWWETFGKFYENNSADYNSAKKLYDKWNALDKSEAWLKLALKSGKISKDGPLFVELMKNPEYSQILTNARKELIKENISQSKNIWELSQEEFDILVQDKLDKYTLDIDSIEKEIESDEDLKLNREGYITTSSEITSLIKQRDWIRNKLRRKYPNASESFINSLYNREAWAIQDQIDEKVEEATIYKNNYDVRMGEKEKIWSLKQTKWEQSRLLFTTMLNSYNSERSRLSQKELVEFQTQQSIFQSKSIMAATNAINNKKVTKWTVDEEGNMVWLNQNWEQIVSKSGLTEIGSSWNFIWYQSKREDWGTDIYTLNKVTWEVTLKSEWLNWEWVIVNNWAKKQWTVTSRGNRVSGDKGLDIAVNKWTDIPSPFNWFVVEVGSSKTFWNFIVTEDENWNRMRIGHLDSMPNLKEGDPIWAGQIIGQAWNSWFILTKDKNTGEWREPTKAEKEAWLWSHLDITSWNARGEIREGVDTEKWLNWEEKPTSKYSVWEINRALSRVPTTLRNAVAEKENFDSIAQEELEKTGGDVGKAMLAIAGWDVTNNQKIAANLEGILLTKDLWTNFSFGWVSSALSSKDNWVVGSAIQSIEAAAIENNPATKDMKFKGKAKVIEVITKSNALLNAIEKELWPDNFGKWDWTIANAEQFFWDAPLFWETESFTKFKADLESLFGGIRTESFGVQLTESEAKFVESFMPSIEDASVSIKAKIDSLKSNTLTAYNSSRKATSLQELNEIEVLDNRALVNKYRGGNKAPWQNYTDTEGSLSEEDLKEIENL